ncbi:hypothetical protein [Haladaptatus litoreus]|uniref:hypothetical protein n=1 Tax=Haladaptatus litoreus TaxID=553468 RepID=UPI00158C332F|nr:hypothetical protein [Haladaptatus litoreus]
MGSIDIRDAISLFSEPVGWSNRNRSEREQASNTGQPRQRTLVVVVTAALVFVMAIAISIGMVATSGVGFFLVTVLIRMMTTRSFGTSMMITRSFGLFLVGASSFGFSVVIVAMSVALCRRRICSNTSDSSSQESYHDCKS